MPSQNELLMSLGKQFEDHFNRPSEGHSFAPARINIIGEHIDYNGGNTLPLAIDRGTYGLFARRSDGALNLYAANYDAAKTFEKDELAGPALAHWSDYVRGAYLALQEDEAFDFPGLDLLIWGNVPDGAGLSSSASLELMVLELLMTLYTEKERDPVAKAKLGQWVENTFIGLQTGLMDQMAIAAGEEDHCILFNSDTVAFERIPMDLKGCRFLVMNSNKRRELRESKYNERRAECEFIDEVLQEAGLLPPPEVPLAVQGTRLCSLDQNGLEQGLKVLDEKFQADETIAIPGGFQTTLENLKRRLRHTVSEEARVQRAVAALKAGDMATLGDLLKASHASLRDDYAVTGHELDSLVDAANAQEGVLGARMCGAGFGGSCIALCRATIEKEELENIQKRYREATGLDCDLFFVAAAGGPGVERKEE